MAEQQPSQRRHPASLIPIAEHNPLLLSLMGRRVSMDMIDYVARQAAKVIRIEGETEPPSDVTRPPTVPLPTPPITPIKVRFSDMKEARDSKETTDLADSPDPEDPPLITLDKFILHLVRCSNVQVGTLLSTLIYLERLRSKLPTMAKGDLSPLFLTFTHRFTQTRSRSSLYAASRLSRHADCDCEISKRLVAKELPLVQLCCPLRCA